MTYGSKSRMIRHSAAVSVPALHSLRGSQIALAAAALPVLGPGWSLDAETDYHGDLCLMIAPPDVQTENVTAADVAACAPAGDLTYVLCSDRDDLIRLARVVNETWQDLGRFEQIGTAIRAIAATRRRGRS